ncbi:hypothetical protein [Croceicoccus bisphenolivorans]|uniref:hypothetical protein n=1 Tax=Croceicoccus bisphenolivorans TaxID=1783232 RepID=UPI00082FF48B|nr:hypothetical protein [Croceicoccus bisphenolivorans]
MTIRINKLADAAALLAASSLAIPAQAASLGVPGINPVANAWSIEDETVHGWERHRRGHRHSDGGGILAGILILGGAVAVAKAIDNSNERKYRERDERYRDYRYRDRPDYDADANYRDRNYPRDDYARRGIDGAIEDCVYEVERSERVATVDTAERDGSGWEVEGDLARGGRFSCSFSVDGRIRDIDIASGSSRSERYDDDDRDDDDDRWGAADSRDEDYYASARERIGEGAPDLPAQDAGVKPSPESADDTWERGAPDDRYDTAKGPDYALVQ